VSGTGLGKNKRNETIEARAARGTIINAIAGSGKGAATQVLTRGREVKVPAETVLTFRLNKPVTLQGER
jgi:hypothetical protein